MPDAFPPEIITKLNFYVYRLIDPRNGETFYVGKGQGNRVFSHARAEITGDAISDKLKRIHEIRLAGFEVSHVIHRHGMDAKTALEVEAALIDAYPGLTNLVVGVGGNDYGVMHAHEIIQRYTAAEAVFQHRALLISVNRTATDMSLYNATRYAWKLNPHRAKRAEIILATMQGLIVGAFVANEWLPATAANFPDRADGEGAPDRFGFNGGEAPDKIKQLYLGKRVPAAYQKRGAANPIKYTFK
ncbi:MAG: LEM-3-like GIY-YIG domain-containing protein [Oscillochloridaceae bacterium umkhey_bin13]